MNIHRIESKDTGEGILELRSQSQDDEQCLANLIPRVGFKLEVTRESDNPLILRIASVVDSDVSTDGADPDLRTMTLEDLQVLCTQRDIQFNQSDRKNTLIKRLEGAQEE